MSFQNNFVRKTFQDRAWKNSDATTQVFQAKSVETSVGISGELQIALNKIWQCKSDIVLGIKQLPQKTEISWMFL